MVESAVCCAVCGVSCRVVSPRAGNKSIAPAMLDAQRLEEQIKAEEEAAAENDTFLRARYAAWSCDKSNLELKKDLALVLCRGADTRDKQLVLCAAKGTALQRLLLTNFLLYSCICISCTGRVLPARVLGGIGKP